MRPEPGTEVPSPDLVMQCSVLAVSRWITLQSFMFQNIESSGLSPTGPAIFLLQSTMFGSGSSGRVTWSWRP